MAVIETSASFDGMRMDVRNDSRRRAVNQEKRSVAAVSKSGDLRKQAPVSQRRGEIRSRLALDEDLVVNQVVASREVDHPHVERAAPAHASSNADRASEWSTAT